MTSQGCLNSSNPLIITQRIYFIMRSRLYPICFIAFLLLAAKSFSQTGQYGNNILTERPNTPINEMVNGYIEVLPASYASNPTKKYPVLIFLEGQSQFGNGGPTELKTLYGLNE